MSMTTAATMYRVIDGAGLLGGVGGVGEIVGEITGEGEAVKGGEAVGEDKGDDKGCAAAADDTIMEVTALELKYELVPENVAVIV